MRLLLLLRGDASCWVGTFVVQQVETFRRVGALQDPAFHLTESENTPAGRAHARGAGDAESQRSRAHPASVHGRADGSERFIDLINNLKHSHTKTSLLGTAV